MKKLLTFLLCVVFSLGVFGVVGCGTNGTKQSAVSNTGTNKPIAQLSVQSVSVPKLGGKTLTAYSTRSGRTGISKRLSATVEPASAQNKLVDYRVFWLGEGDHTSELVTDYVVVEQDSDGSTDATVTCIQPFDDDTIVIQVVTRDGGYTAECVATYAGFISEMSITSSTLNTVNTAARGDYYELLTNNTYTFNVNMDNVFHNVGTYDLSVTTDGSDEMFWFYDKVMYSSEDDTWRRTDSSAFSRSLRSIVDKFITATINNNVVTVTVKGKQLSDYYEETNATFYYNRSFVFASSRISGGIPQDERDNANNLPSAYFTVTVTDAKTNISETIKLWIKASVDSVSLSEQAIEF